MWSSATRAVGLGLLEPRGEQPLAQPAATTTSSSTRPAQQPLTSKHTPNTTLPERVMPSEAVAGPSTCRHPYSSRKAPTPQQQAGFPPPRFKRLEILAEQLPKQLAKYRHQAGFCE